jgi:hypothetical protein
MPIQQFTAYDIIVDALPGSFALLLLLPILPMKFIGFIFKQGVASGVIIIATGYIVGRFIHTVSPDLDELNILERNVANDGMATLVVSELADMMIGSSNESEEKVTVPNFAGDNIEEVISYGQSILYGKDTLYGKYEMLSTFFRSLFFVLYFLSFIYLLRGLTELTFELASITISGYSSALPGFGYVLLAPIFYGLSKIGKYGWETFVRRKARAFIHELHRELNLEYQEMPKPDSI